MIMRNWTRDGDADSRALGSHSMVIADHNGAFKPNGQASVNFTQPGAVMKVDSIDQRYPDLATEQAQLMQAITSGAIK